MLRKTQNWGHRNSTLDHFGDVDVVNKYFTSVVCDKSYSKYTLLSELHSQPKADDANPPVKSYSDLYFMVILSKVTKNRLDLMVFLTGHTVNVPLNFHLCCLV